MNQTPQTPLDQLLEFLRFPSVSTDSAFAKDVANCADWLREKFRAIGLESEVYPTPGHPVVIAKNAHQDGRKTILIYGHYDVQPADPLELWTHPPFEPHVENGRIFARGATDNKGQIFAHILGVEEALKIDGELPLNVIFLVEGEEEIGSPNIERFLRDHREELRCDVIAISDTGMVAPGVPTLTYGLRGVAAAEITVSGPTMDLHSGIFGGAIANPITALAQMLATLHDANGKVAVAGFYDDVQPIEPWEKTAWENLPLNDDSLRELTGVPALSGEEGFSAVERIFARPTLELNGIGGGYQGEGSKTVIPQKAFAKITCRLVPNQKPHDIIMKVKTHLEKICPPGVTVAVSEGHSGEAYLCDPHSANGEAAQRALEKVFGAKCALIREGGSIPIVTTFKNVLGAETLLLGLALPDARAHSPNENFPIENFEAGIRLNRALLAEISESA